MLSSPIFQPTKQMQKARQAIAKAEHRILQRHQRLCTPAFSSNNIFLILEVLWLCTPAVPTRTTSSSDRPQNRPALAFLCLVSSQQKEHCQFFSVIERQGHDKLEIPSLIIILKVAFYQYTEYKPRSEGGPIRTSASWWLASGTTKVPWQWNNEWLC